jgi:hypothetical protein
VKEEMSLKDKFNEQELIKLFSGEMVIKNSSKGEIIGYFAGGQFLDEKEIKTEKFNKEEKKIKDFDQFFDEVFERAVRKVLERQERLKKLSYKNLPENSWLKKPLEKTNEEAKEDFEKFYEDYVKRFGNDLSLNVVERALEKPENWSKEDEEFYQAYVKRIGTHL